MLTYLFSQENWYMPLKMSVCLIVIVFIVASCTDKNPHGTDVVPITALTGLILTVKDSTGIDSANVVVCNANTNAPVTRVFSDGTGRYFFAIDSGTYYLKVTAQGYFPSPPKGSTALSFQVFKDDTTIKNIYLRSDTLADSCGSVYGKVLTPASAGLGGVLIVAKDTTTSRCFSGTSSSDGYYILFNIKPGIYSINCFLAGYLQVTIPVIVTVFPDSSVNLNPIILQQNAMDSLRGQISFLASPNSRVDITLIHPVTREAIPGLSIFNDTTGNTYVLTGIPYGTFIAWASYRNDQYVMDPDRIRKFGLPFVTFHETSLSQTLNFEVTGAIQIVSPSNHPDTIVPQTIPTTRPIFCWKKYPSAKEYIIEITDEFGKRIWGGFDASGTILHLQIGARDTSAAFNFDGSAVDTLRYGMTYRWKVYADKDAQLNIQGLISSSEDLLGIFKPVKSTRNLE